MSLVMPNSDPWDRFVYPHFTHMLISYRNQGRDKGHLICCRSLGILCHSHDSVFQGNDLICRRNYILLDISKERLIISRERLFESKERQNIADSEQSSHTPGGSHQASGYINQVDTDPTYTIQ